MNRTLKVTLAVAATAAGAVLVSKTLLPNHVEEPRYEVLHRYAGLEVRGYAASVVAETRVKGAYRESLNQGFRTLARYIFGGNLGAREIAMTAPVNLQQAAQPGAKIAMTAPVGHARADDGWVITFTMPASYTLASLPRPIDPQVSLHEVPAHKVAALRFSGWVSEELAERKKQELLAQLRQEQLVPAGEPVLAQYDPPWVLPFLRRNEVLIDLAA